MGGYGALPAGLDRQALLGAVAEALRPWVGHGAAALVAVSGGPDSCALAALVAEARPDLRLVLGHVRHGLRDDAADARAAAELAAALGLRFAQREVAVTVSGEGPEAAARVARYAALTALARAHGARILLVGHTADDRAETLLLNLARGSGLRGLAAMRVASPRLEGERAAEVGASPAGGEPLTVVRPLLAVRRADVRAFVEGEGLAAVADPTNADPDQRRRRVRAEVLPALARLSGGPGDPVAALTRLADLAADDADALDALAVEHARRLVARWGPGCAIPRRDVTALPRALATRVLRLALAHVRGGLAGLAAADVARVLDLRSGQALDLGGGVRVTCGGGWLAAVPTGSPPLASRPLTVPGRTALEELGAVIHVDVGSRDDLGQGVLPLGAPAAGDPPVAPPGPLLTPPGARQAGWATVRWDGGPLSVRSRRRGERIQTAGGSRRLQDVLVDAGVPRALRDLVPVVADADDAALWVPGLAVRERPGDAAPDHLARLWLAPLAVSADAGTS